MLRASRYIALLATVLLSTSSFAEVFTVQTTIDGFLKNDRLRSVRSQPIQLIRIERQAARLQKASMDAAAQPDVSRFLIQGGLHGDEVITTTFVEWLAKRTQSGESPLNKLPGSISIDFLPSVNPDTYRKSRYNSNNINLNRNFGILWGLSREPHGSEAFSEPETKAIRALMESQRYLAAVDVHGYVDWVVAPSFPQQAHTNAANQVTRHKAWLEALRKHLPLLGPYQLKTAGSLGDGGAFEDWAFWGNKTLAFCLEMASPQRFVPNKNGVNEDRFLAYENYIYQVFNEALSIKAKERPTAKSTAPQFAIN